MNKSILPLLVLVTIAVVLSLILQPENKSTDTYEGLMFEQLQSRAQDVNRLMVKNAEGILLDARQTDGVWVANNYQGYPVDKEPLGSLLQHLVQARKAEPKTSKAKNYSRLGVEALSSENAQSTLVEVFIGEELMAQLLVGRTASAGGSYVRVPQEEQSWLVSKQFSVPVNDTDWLAQPILGIELDNVKSVTLEGEQGWLASKESASKGAADSASFVLQDLPEGRALKYDSLLENVVSSLMELNFDALSKVDEHRWERGTLTNEFTIQLFDDSVIKMELHDIDDKQFVRFFQKGSNSHWTQWRYEVTSFSVNQFNKTMEDLLAEVEEPVAEQEGQE